MKKFNLLAICLIAFTGLLFTACKKDKPSQAELLRGIWGVESFESKLVENGVIKESEKYIGKAGDFVNFKDEKNLEYSLDGEKETLIYQLLENNKIFIDEELYTIVTLTSTELVLTSKSGDNLNFEEETIRLKK